MSRPRRVEGDFIETLSCSIDGKIISEKENMEVLVSRYEHENGPLYFSIRFNNHYGIYELTYNTIDKLMESIKNKNPVKLKIGKDGEYRFPHAIEENIRRKKPAIIYPVFGGLKNPISQFKVDSFEGKLDTPLEKITDKTCTEEFNLKLPNNSLDLLSSFLRKILE